MKKNQKNSNLSGKDRKVFYKLQEAFAIYDNDNDGFVSVNTLGTLMRYLSHNPTEDEVSKSIEAMKKNKNSTISFDEFAVLMMNKEIEDMEDKVLEAFQVFDVNGSGFVSAEELRHVLTSVGDKLSEVEAGEMIRKAKVGADGLINYKDFFHSMKSK
jgi:calmodulin